MDYFEIVNKNKINVSMDKRTVTQTAKFDVWSKVESIFGSVTIPSNNNEYIYKWSIKINGGPLNSEPIFFGISSGPFKTNQEFHTGSHYSYAIGSNEAAVQCIDQRLEWIEFANSYDYLQENDTVNLCLDLRKEILRFTKTPKNKNEKEIVLREFDIEIGTDIAYKLAVMLFDKNLSVTITDFQQTFQL